MSRFDLDPCGSVRPYYRDYIDPEARSAIPQPMLRHIAGCDYCLGQISRLRQELLQAQMVPPALTDQLITALLGQHFLLADKKVDCPKVRQFLPGLADPKVDIRIPTPVTVHIERCQACREDLDLLKALRLRPDQLSRLGQLLAGKGGPEVLCEAAAAYIHDIANFDLGRVGPDVMCHVFACARCHEQLYAIRAGLLEHMEAKFGHQCHQPAGLGCQVITDADLFDLLLPSSLDDDRYARFVLPVCAHLRRCPSCLARCQQITRQVRSIFQRPSSGVVTVFSIPSGHSQSAEAGHTSGPKRAMPVAVGLGLVVVLSLVGIWAVIPRASADPFSGIVKALEAVKYLHISSFAGDGRSLQEFWLDRDSGSCLIRHKDQLVLWDIKLGLRRAIDPSTGILRAEPADEADLAWLRAIMHTGFGLIPFGDMRSLPAGAQVAELDQVGLGSANQEIRQLTWLGPGWVRYKWQVVVDHQTLLPKQASYYVQDPDGAYRLHTVLRVEYPSAQEVQNMLEALMD